MLSPLQGPTTRLIWEDYAYGPRTRSLAGPPSSASVAGSPHSERRCSFELGPTRTSQVALVPWNEIKGTSDPSLLPNTRQRAPVSSVRFRLIVTDSSSGVRSVGYLPPRPETTAFHDAWIASADRTNVTGGVFFRPKIVVATEPLTPLSRTLLDTGTRFFAERVDRFGRTRRDRFDSTAVTR